MSGKMFVWLLITVLLTTAPPAEAQQRRKSPELGIYRRKIQLTESARAEGIRLALRELGYVEGQNIAIEYRYSEGKTDRAPRACSRAGASQGRYHRRSRRNPLDRGGQERDQDDSYRHGGRWKRPC